MPAMSPQLLALMQDLQSAQDPYQEDEMTAMLPVPSSPRFVDEQYATNQLAMTDPNAAPEDADMDYDPTGSGGSQSPYAISGGGPGAGPDMAALMRMIGAGPKPKQTLGQRFASALPTILRGALAGGATPNIAGGGATDLFRAANAGLGAADAQENRQLGLEDRQLGRGLQLFKIAEAMQNNAANQQRLGLESQARQSYLKAQADSHKARAAQILDNMKRGIIVVDRKGALKLNPATGQYEPMDFTEQNIIREIAGYTKALRQQGWNDEEIKDAIKRKYTEFKDPKPVVKSPAEIKLDEQRRLSALTGKYLRAANGNAELAIRLAQADQADPEFAQYGGLSDQDFAMIEVDLRKRIPKPTKPTAPNTGLIRLNQDQQEAGRADQFMKDSGGDPKKALEAAQKAGDTEAAKRIKPLVPTNQKTNLFAGASGGSGGGKPASSPAPASPTKKTYDPKTRTLR